MLRPIELGEPLITDAQIQERVGSLAEEIRSDYAKADLPLSVIVVLKGACFFAIDLMIQRRGLDRRGSTSQRHHAPGSRDQCFAD
jgi:hypoxanthine-guanine phosphoribosyltransferase